MIIVPSRELALQIDEVLRKMGTGLKVTVCYGGHKREIEEQNLIQSPTVIIGTTGRIAAVSYTHLDVYKRQPQKT